MCQGTRLVGWNLFITITCPVRTNAFPSFCYCFRCLASIINVSENFRTRSTPVSSSMTSRAVFILLWLLQDHCATLDLLILLISLTLKTLGRNNALLSYEYIPLVPHRAGLRWRRRVLATCAHPQTWNHVGIPCTMAVEPSHFNINSQGWETKGHRIRLSVESSFSSHLDAVSEGMEKYSRRVLHESEPIKAIRGLFPISLRKMCAHSLVSEDILDTKLVTWFSSDLWISKEWVLSV